MGVKEQQFKWPFSITTLREINHFMGARKDQIKRRFNITILRDELFHGARVT